MSKEDRDIVTGCYKTMAANASSIGNMSSRLQLHLDHDYRSVVELAEAADTAVQLFHDAMGCLLLESSIAERNRQNTEDRALLDETRAKLPKAKGKRKR